MNSPTKDPFDVVFTDSFTIFDERFKSLLCGNVHLQKIWTGALWAEGPAYFPAGRYLIWSDIPNNRIMRWDETSGAVSEFRNPSNYTNGHTVDREGRLVHCEHGGRCVSRTEHDGSRTVLASHFQGKRFNSPNDVVVKSDGSLWFTDPTYGIDSDYEGFAGESEIGASNVYRIDPDGSIAIVADDFVKPNGLAFSPDEAKMYIVDTGRTHRKDGPRHMRVFDVADGRRLKGGEVFAVAESGLYDGIRCDIHGNVWASAGDGVYCYTPKAEMLGKVNVPEVVANLCFGGPKRSRMFICGTTSLYAVQLGVKGALRPG
jgi:gluconolactonase